MQHGTIVVVAGGPASLASVPEVPADATVIAADGGVDRALELGLRVDLAIGDFDSVTPEGLAAVEAAGARIERHPAAKDATDLELALEEAVSRDPARIVVLGSGGGRLDHLLGSLLLLGSERYAVAEIDAYLGSAVAHIVRGTRELAGTPGELVSLLLLHGPAVVTTHGLIYPLTAEILAAGSTRGISNLFATKTASVELERGTIAVIRPGKEHP